MSDTYPTYSLSPEEQKLKDQFEQREKLKDSIFEDFRFFLLIDKLKEAQEELTIIRSQNRELLAHLKDLLKPTKGALWPK